MFFVEDLLQCVILIIREVHCKPKQMVSSNILDTKVIVRAPG